jgi:hypothetical protein
MLLLMRSTCAKSLPMPRIIIHDAHTDERIKSDAHPG